MLALAVMTILGPRAQTNINLLNYTGYSGCPGYPLPAAQASPWNNMIDVRPQLQAAIDYVANNGGGTVTIPGDLCPWYLSKPVFLDRDNVTIDGAGSAIFAPDDRVYRAKCRRTGARYPPASERAGDHPESSHRPLDSWHGQLDPRIDLLRLKHQRTERGGTATVYAHGYFDGCLAASGQPCLSNGSATSCWQCPFINILGYDVNNGQYDNATNTPTPQNYRYTFDIAFKQNTSGTLTGTIMGSGMVNDMTQPETYWMLGTFPNDADPNNVKFKFQVGNPDTGAYTIESLVLGQITDTNVHRVTVQMDLGGIPQTYSSSNGGTWTINNYTTVNNPTASAWLDGVYTSSVTLSSPSDTGNPCRLPGRAPM